MAAQSSNQRVINPCEIAPDIFTFDSGPFNFYLIRENGRITLVDAAFPGYYGVFRDGLAAIGHSLTDLEAIILTHAHADHIGFAERVRNETKVPVFVHKEDRVLASRPLQLPWPGLLSNAWRPYVATLLGVATLNGVFSMSRITKLQPFSDNAVLDVPGHPQVLHTPGHTAGEVAFLLADRNVLISGDTLVTRNLLTGELGRPQLPSPILNSNDKQANRSLDRLRELGQVTMLAGHGKPWRGNMAEAVAGARQSA